MPTELGKQIFLNAHSTIQENPWKDSGGYGDAYVYSYRMGFPPSRKGDVQVVTMDNIAGGSSYLHEVVSLLEVFDVARHAQHITPSLSLHRPDKVLGYALGIDAAPGAIRS